MDLTAETARTWLRARGIESANASLTELGGGVSNHVILVEGPEFRAVLKQSLGKLRVGEIWLSNRDRVFREAAALSWLSGRVSGGRIPRLLYEDPAEFTIAMEAAPPAAEMWKVRLFRGELEAETARAAGALLASIISVTWHNSEARELFQDQTVFRQLRIDPYYRAIADRHPAVAEYIASLIARSAGRRVCLVHGDWSPKNLLTDGGGIWAIDWEVVHFGDPSFDVAFLWNHLLLKSIARPELRGGLAELTSVFNEALLSGLNKSGLNQSGLQNEANCVSSWVTGAALEHLPALLLARVDGKSPAEYLDETMRNRARAMALGLISRPANSIGEIFER